MKLNFGVISLVSLTCCLLTTHSHAASKDCPGKVLEMMDHSNPAICDGRLAFRLDSTGTTYLCTLSTKGDAMVLAAFHTGKTISPRLDLPVAGDCLSIQGGASYVKPAYIRETD